MYFIFIFSFQRIRKLKEGKRKRLGDGKLGRRGRDLAEKNKMEGQKVEEKENSRVKKFGKGLCIYS